MKKTLRFKSWLIVVLIIFVSFIVVGCDKTNNGDGGNDDDDNYDYLDLTVRDAIGEHGMVSSASAYASQVGYQILKDGGNAFDAAVAVAYALNVVEPNASGVGGGGFLVGYDAKTKQSVAYNYREFAPSGATVDRYKVGDIGFGDGPGSVGVPMFVDGTLTVLEKHGTKTREEVISPAIKLAREGFKIAPTLASVISDNYSKLMRTTGKEDNLKVYTDGISPLEEGDTLINENLANTLQKIVDEGKEGFYQGDIALAIVNGVNQAAGSNLLTMADLKRAINLTQTLDPLTGTYRGYDIVSMPPCGGGIAVIEALNLLEQYGEINKLTHNSSEYLHVMSAAQQLAFGDRRKFIADPNFVDIPTAGIINKEYAKSRWTNFDPLKGIHFSGAAEFGDPWLYNGETKSTTYSEGTETKSASTTSFSVVDAMGNIVAATHTINYFFGSGIVPAGTGIHLNNELSGFNTNPSSASVIEPYKIPLSSMAPTIILKDGRPVLSVGSPGSMRIIAAIVQVIVNVLDFEMDIQTAIEKPRIYHYIGSDLELEGAISNKVIEELRSLGYTVSVNGNPSGYDAYFGGVHAIHFNQKDNTIHGGADRRRDGKAIGW